MSETFSKQKGNITVYCCGGCGINLGLSLENLRGKDEPGFAKISFVYVDTADSNHDETKIGVNNSYRIPGVDGSGQVRAENQEVISLRIREILQKFQPDDLAIVLHSASGGSGSVFGPLLARELALKNQPVLSIMVGATDTRKYAENTLNTILSYQKISTGINTPLIVAYAENSLANSTKQVDHYVRETILSLSCLFSRENRELDSRDLANWLNFSRVTNYPSGLAALQFGADIKSIERRTKHMGGLGSIITVATLARDRDYPRLENVIPSFQVMGIVPDKVELSITQEAPLHFITCDGFFHDVGERIQAFIKKFDEDQKALVSRRSVLTSAVPTTDTGLVV